MSSDEFEGDLRTTYVSAIGSVVEDALEKYVEVNEFEKRAYYSKSLLRYDYPDLSDQQADQVRSALTREADPETLADLDGTDTPPTTGEGKS